MASKAIAIKGKREISAIYYALLQRGYEFFSLERGEGHISAIRGFAAGERTPDFFADARQSTCAVYPFWPRAAMLERAACFLRPDGRQFEDFDGLRAQILSAENLLEEERGPDLWPWLLEFPAALGEVLSHRGFARYWQWAEGWLAEQNQSCREELFRLRACMEQCESRFGSSVKALEIVLDPIKCVYSSDYIRKGERLIFCSGALRVESVVHELLHPAVHPQVLARRRELKKQKYPGIDESYYLSGDAAGQANAFEEYAVRVLTGRVMAGDLPKDLPAFLQELEAGEG